MVFYFTSSSGEWARRPPGSFLNTGALSWDPQAVASSAGGASSLALSAPLPSRVPLRQGLGAVKGPFPLRTLRSGVLFPQSQRPPVATWSWVEFVGFSLPTPVCGLYSDCTLVITHFEEERRPASCSASQEVRLTLLGMGRRAWMRQKAVKRPWNGHAATPWTWLMSRSILTREASALSYHIHGAVPFPVSQPRAGHHREASGKVLDHIPPQAWGPCCSGP